MPTVRLSLVGTVILTLLGGLAGTAVARTDGSTMVTGSVLSVEVVGDLEWSEEGVMGEDWVGHGRGIKNLVGFEWSDPRLPSQAEMIGNFDGYGPAGVVINNMWLLEGPDGYWTGPWIGWCDSEEPCQGMVTLTGHGAFEGFYAILAERPQEDPTDTVTQVLESGILHGEMPPLPEPLEPPTE